MEGFGYQANGNLFLVFKCIILDEKQRSNNYIPTPSVVVRDQFVSMLNFGNDIDVNWV